MDLEEFEKLPPEKRAEMEAMVQKRMKEKRFMPNPGPQTTAYYSPADVMLYGGSAGSGKSGLILGLSHTEHVQSLIMRRKFTDIEGLTTDAMRLFGGDGFAKLSGGARPKIKTADNRVISFGACKNEGDEESFQGVPHDLLAYDEVTHFTEHQFRYLQTWVRTVDPDQRTRVIAASNPPTSAQGEWVIGYWRPWLDPTHENPAEHGELRWFVTDPDGKDIEVDGPEPYAFAGRDPVLPKSRTFIPGLIKDNPYLGDSYRATLDALPEPLRSAMRDGNFMLSRKDDLRQLIPTQWVRDAMARWETNRSTGVPQCAIGVDPAQGGPDETVLSPRYDGWFDELIRVPGEQTPGGDDVAALVLKHRRDNSAIILDMGGGYGGGTMMMMKSNDIKVTPYKGNTKTDKKTKDRTMGFANTRSAAYWAMREALDPSQPGGSPISLPNDTKLLNDLTAPTFDLVAQGFKVEPKASVRDKIGRSPDGGDAVVMSWFDGLKGVAPTHPAQAMSHARPKRGKVVMGHPNKRGGRRR